jgi:hypothetical protein
LDKGFFLVGEFADVRPVSSLLFITSIIWLSLVTKAGTEYFMVGVSTVGVSCIDNQPTRRIIAFASTEYLRDLANADIFSCDGTFYTCPKLFYQIYSMHIPIDDIMTPVIYDFLPGKSQAAYTRFFTLIKDKIADLGWSNGTTNCSLDLCNSNWVSLKSCIAVYIFGWACCVILSLLCHPSMLLVVRGPSVP